MKSRLGENIKSHKNEQNFKLFDIATLNVCGLRRRSNFPEFLEFVQRFDLLCLNETKIDETDVISFPGYDS